jgi:hypothetical protein
LDAGADPLAGVAVLEAAPVLGEAGVADAAVSSGESR